PGRGLVQPRQGDISDPAREVPASVFPGHREPGAYHQVGDDPTDALDCTLSPEEIMDKLEQRVGPKGRKLFEQFLRKVNKLQVQQHLEAQAQMGVTARSGEKGPG